MKSFHTSLFLALSTLFALGSAATADDLVRLDLSGLDSSKAIAGTTSSGDPSAYKNRGAILAFNGAGMSADGLTHGTTAENTMYMMSANNNGNFPWYIQVDLGTTQRLDAVRLYNFNFNVNDSEGRICTIRGPRNFGLYVSTDATWKTSAADIQSVYTLALSGVLPQASGTADYAGVYFPLDTPINARFVALVALDDWDDTKTKLNYNGIAEIQLFSGGAPLEPPSTETESACAPFSICCVGDSITEGANSSSAANKYSYRLYLPGLLADAGFTNVTWKGSHISSYSGSPLPSEGWCGNSPEQVANKYVANAADDAADVLLLHAGHNCDATQQSEADIIAAVTNAHARIIAAARANNPNAVILDAKVITSTKLPKYSYIPALNEAIGALAAELSTADSPVIAVDMADGWDPATMCLSDMVHPTEAGARRMAETWFAALAASPFMAGTDLLLEAEAFVRKGGWVVDPQFTDIMGSPYLLAHGKGSPVADASTSVAFGAQGLVRAWVRTRDWTPDWEGEKPGRFILSVCGASSDTLGVEPPDWGWVDAGTFRVSRGSGVVSLHDLTGFEGRCDALWFSPAAETNAPPAGGADLAAWRAAKRGESAPPEDVVTADFVVVGGGIAGTCAAVAAADAGIDVILVQDRPMLGGNASDEIRVKTEKAGHEYHWIVQAVKNTSENAKSKAGDDANRMAFVAGYPNLSVHTLWRAYGVVTNAERRIVAVDARHVETGARRRFVAPLYCDATGDGWIGYWAGAAYMHGREAKTEFNEPTHGQDVADTSTMGNSLLWTTKTGSEPVEFPAVPWATKVSGSRANTSGDWTWEAGLDPSENTIYDAEMLRDRLFRAIYGSFSNAKAQAGNESRELDFMPYIAGKRESRRIVGDYIVRESDVINHRLFEDAIGIATWSVDLHRPNGNSGFLAATTHYNYGAWWMPYRSLCCRDVPNLFLAGRCASYTHVAFGSSRVMHAGGQQGVAAGYAASLCRQYGCDPREIYCDAAKTEALQALINKRSEYTWPELEPTEREVCSVIVDNTDTTGVEISGAWSASTYNPERYGANYLHNNRAASENLWVRYTPDLPSNTTYRVYLFWNGDDTRSAAVPVEIVYDGGITTNYVNMTVPSDTWNEIGNWSFAAGTQGSVRIMTIGQAEKNVIADAVKFSIVESLEQPDDLDGNGLPDAWERRHFLQITGTDPDADPDADGYSNLAEYQAGSDPNNPASYPFHPTVLIVL